MIVSRGNGGMLAFRKVLRLYLLSTFCLLQLSLFAVFYNNRSLGAAF